MRPLPLALCCLLFLCGCAPVVKKDMLVPAPAAEVARLTRLKVAAFDNDRGGQVRAAVESALASIVVEDRPYFTMVGANASATDLGKPLQWVDTSKSKGGQPIRYGAEGTVQGSVGQNSWQDERYTETRKECAAEDAKGRCVLWSNRQVQCIRRVAQFSFTPRVVAKDTGAVLFSQEFSETGQSSACLDKDSPASGAALLAGASKKAIARFRNEVAPHSVTVDIPLLTEDGSGMSAQVRAQVAQGLDLAKARQNAKACALWRSAARSHAAGHALPYLSGVCAELEDDLDQAEDFYALAEQRAPKPVPEITAALARIKNTRASQGRLEQQLK